jgi:hypothetical protein
VVMLHVHSLGVHKLDAGPSIAPATPITPQQRSRANHERMQQHADLARLFGGMALPLTLLTQRTGAATAHTGSIHHPQASIGFRASLVDSQRLACRAAQGPIWLEGKLSTREATGFPEQSHIWWPISLGGRRKVGYIFVRRRAGRGKLGGAHRIRMKLMTQFQTHCATICQHSCPQDD